jgi:hypothetical protein
MSVYYIAGPITGVKSYQHDFATAEWRLNQKGHIAFNPAVLPNGLPHDVYMPICYAMMDACEAVYFLNGWRDSAGARMEYEYAVSRKMKIQFEEIPQ